MTDTVGTLSRAFVERHVAAVLADPAARRQPKCAICTEGDRLRLWVVRKVGSDA